MKKLFLVIIYLTTFFIKNAVAAPTLSIDPSSLKVHAPENIFVDINISGLQSGDTNALLGGWELDFTYDPNVFTFLAVPPAGPGGALGDIDLGEAINLAGPVTTPGIFHVGVLSLLEGDVATCVFCIAPFLEDLQGDSFTLATVGLFLPGGSSFTGSTPLNLENVVLSNANGISIESENDGSIVFVPEPGVLLLIIMGFFSISIICRKKNSKNLNDREFLKISTQLKLSLILLPLLGINQNVQATASYEGIVTIDMKIASIENITTPGDLTSLNIQVGQDSTGTPVDLNGNATGEAKITLDDKSLNPQNLIVGDRFILQNTVTLVANPIGSASVQNWGGANLLYTNSSATDTFVITLTGNILAEANGSINDSTTETLSGNVIGDTVSADSPEAFAGGEGNFSESDVDEFTFSITVEPQVNYGLIIRTFNDGSASSVAVAEDALELQYTIRDFSATHPNFELGFTQLDPGIVDSNLGGDGKPLYIGGTSGKPTTNGAANFDEWYREAPGVNLNDKASFTLHNTFTPNPNVFTFRDNNYFPIDNRLFKNEGEIHNFHFTAEFHARFQYRGGEVLTYTSDDDLWVFINNKLAVDLGGIHSAETREVNLDSMAAQLGITPGRQYDFNLFFAERQKTGSVLRFDIPTPVVNLVNLREIDLIKESGDKLITLDTLTGLQWLDLTESRNRSYLDMVGPANDCNPRCLTGDFKGWTFASQDDVEELFLDAGLPVYNIVSPFSEVGEDILSFIQTVGPTRFDPGPTREEEIWEALGITRSPLKDAPDDIFEFVVSPFAYWAPCCGEAATDSIPFGFRLTLEDDFASVWLYRTFPGLSVMPLGDSLTLGFRAPPGYREFLRDKLRDANFAIDYVGPTKDQDSDDLFHDGRTRRTINGVMKSGSWEKFKPAVILLMAGTNDFLQSSLTGDGDRCVFLNNPSGIKPAEAFAEELESLIDTIRPVAVDLFVASIPPINRVYWTGQIPCSQEEQLDAEITQYNQNVENLTNKYTDVHFVDISAALTLEDYDDGVHPRDEKGYEKMADVWVDAIRKVFKEDDTPVSGDLNRDGIVDRSDLTKLLAARNIDVVGEDPRDINGDGTINILDARKLVLLCTNSRCQ